MNNFRNISQNQSETLFFIPSKHPFSKMLFINETLNMDNLNLNQNHMNGMLSLYRQQPNCVCCSFTSIQYVFDHMHRQNHLINDLSYFNIFDCQIDYKTKEINWIEKINPNSKNRVGLTFTELNTCVHDACKINQSPVQTINTFCRNKDNAKFENNVINALKELKYNQSYLLAHFIQGRFTQTWYGSHISPVIAYQEDLQKVLIADVDNEIGQPYWVDLNLFLEAISDCTNIWGQGGVIQLIKSESNSL